MSPLSAIAIFWTCLQENGPAPKFAPLTWPPRAAFVAPKLRVLLLEFKRPAST
jgi:hypothetical protein